MPIHYEIARGKPPSDDRRTIDTNSYGSCHLAPGTLQTMRCGARCSAARFPVSVGLCSDRAALRLMPRVLQVASTSPVANDLFPWSSASYRQGHSALDATHRHSWPCCSRPGIDKRVRVFLPVDVHPVAVTVDGRCCVVTLFGEL